MSSDDNRKSNSTLLMLLFIGSGFAALVYEIVWFRLLRLTIGSSQISLAILLVSFMGGMCLGSILFHKLVSDRYHPLRVYGFIELAIGACGLLVLIVLPHVTKLYLTVAGYGQLNIIARGLICLIFLLPATMLMGATLPAVARLMKGNASGASRLGRFYGANIIGAVFGTAVAGFYLLRVFDVYIASLVAIAINLVVAMIGFRLAGRTEYLAAKRLSSPTRGITRNDVPIFIAITLSGFTALGAQVIWTRLLSVLFGATVYTFSVILSVFLAGLGIGSLFGAKYGRRSTRPVIVLAVCQAMLVPAIAFASIAIVDLVPFMDTATPEATWLSRAAIDVLRTAIAILPATVIWGASFPLAIVATGIERPDPGRIVGFLYALNTVGAIAAVAIVSAVLMPVGGTKLAQQALIVTAGASSIVLSFRTLRTSFSITTFLSRWRTVISGSFRMVGVLTPVALVFWFVLLVPSPRPGLIAYGREIQQWDSPAEYLHVGEGVSAFVAVSSQRETGYRSLHIDGKVVASTFPKDMRLQRMLGHVPALFHSEPKSVLIIGLGAGVTAGTFVLHKSIERIVIVEIEPEVVGAAAKYFSTENYDVVNDPRTEIIYDDARHYLSTTEERFDIITTDPINPWLKGAAALYTKEFYDLCKTRMNSGGVISQWVPLYETNSAAVKSEIGTFFETFPDGSIWTSQQGRGAYDVFMLAGRVAITPIARVIGDKIASNSALRRSLAEIDIYTEMDIFRSFAGRYEHMTDWIRGFEVNLDRNLRLEYLAGLALDVRVEQNIYSAMTELLSFPKRFFVLSENEEHELRQWFEEEYRAN